MRAGPCDHDMALAGKDGPLHVLQPVHRRVIDAQELDLTGQHLAVRAEVNQRIACGHRVQVDRDAFGKVSVDPQELGAVLLAVLPRQRRSRVVEAFVKPCRVRPRGPAEKPSCDLV